MNFKLTKSKIILMIILGLLITLLLSFLVHWISCSGTTPLCEQGKQCDFRSGCSGINWHWLIPSLETGLFVFILTYIVYSLVEKKK
jgi:hypothetical protein